MGQPGSLPKGASWEFSQFRGFLLKVPQIWYTIKEFWTILWLNIREKILKGIVETNWGYPNHIYIIIYYILYCFQVSKPTWLSASSFGIVWSWRSAKFGTEDGSLVIRFTRSESESFPVKVAARLPLRDFRIDNRTTDVGLPVKLKNI